VLVANYGGGTAAVLPVLPNGSLGEAVDVESPGVNPHLIRTDASNRFAFVPNKGSDTVSQFLFDEATGRLDPSSPPRVDTAAGAGPRHLDFHPTAPYAFVINELGDTVVAYAFDAASGTLSPRQTVPTLPDSFDASQNFCADLHVSVDGRFLYGSSACSGWLRPAVQYAARHRGHRRPSGPAAHGTQALPPPRRRLGRRPHRAPACESAH
jgi:6-phosphogluconolactonase